MKLKISLFLLLCGTAVQAQLIRGVVVDDQNSKPIAFLSLGIEGTPIGTITEMNGQFELTIPEKYKDAILTFYGVGFDRKDVALAKLSGELNTIRLNPVEVKLDEVVVSRKPDRYEIKEYETGKRSKGKSNLSVSPRNPEFSGAMISSPIAVNQAHFLTKASVFLFESQLDTVKLALRIFEVDSENAAPGKDILNRPIVRSFTKKKGWLDIDLSEEHIYLDFKDYYLAFELIEEQRVRYMVRDAQLAYEKKLEALYDQGVKGLEKIVVVEDGQERTRWKNSFSDKQKKRYGLNLSTFSTKFELVDGTKPGMFRSSGFDRWRNFGNKVFRMKLSYEVPKD